MRFKIDWASHRVGSKFTVFDLFYSVFEGNFPSTSPRGAYIWRGDLTEGFFALPFSGAYIWRGLYVEGLIFGILGYLARTSEQRIGSGIGKSSDNRTSPPKKVCKKTKVI